jgi:hypothetical protein
MVLMTSSVSPLTTDGVVLPLETKMVVAKDSGEGERAAAAQATPKCGS